MFYLYTLQTPARTQTLDITVDEMIALDKGTLSDEELAERYGIPWGPAGVMPMLSKLVLFAIVVFALIAITGFIVNTG